MFQNKNKIFKFINIMIKKTIPYLIIANEFCERYSFYALKTVLFSFLRNELNLSNKLAIFVVHFFVSMCYMFTLFGGLISDIFLGKYKTILYLSIVYFLGTLLVAFSSYTNKLTYLIYLGLGLISFGTGGIKPCVAAFGGDQIGDNGDHKKLNKFFSFFYFAINMGSMISTFFVPIMADASCFGKETCYPLAFGSSSFLLFISIVLFFLGSKHYIKKRPNKQKLIDMCGKLKNLFNSNKNNTKSLDEDSIAKEIFEKQSKKFCYKNLFKLFLPVAFFWMLYDQQSSTWVEQGFKMSTKAAFFNSEFIILSSQMQTWNFIFILCFIPLFSQCLYPFIESLGFKLTPIKKMASGIFLASVSFLVSAILEHAIFLSSASNSKICILWQLPQYILLTAGEILLNMTGLEFAYSEAPDTIKTSILAAWLLTVTFGNFLVIIYSALSITSFLSVIESETFNFFIYSFLGLIAALYLFKYEATYIKNK